MTERICAHVFKDGTVCGKPHHWTQERGFYGADGHPFRVVQGETPKLTESGGHGADRDGWRASFFGALVSCERCGATCDPKHRDLLALHEERCS